MFLSKGHVGAPGMSKKKLSVVEIANTQFARYTWYWIKIQIRKLGFLATSIFSPPIVIIHPNFMATVDFPMKIFYCPFSPGKIGFLETSVFSILTCSIVR